MSGGLELTNIIEHTGAVIQARGASCSYGGIRGGRQCEGAEYSEELHRVDMNKNSSRDGRQEVVR